MNMELSFAARMEIQAEEDSFRSQEFGNKSAGERVERYRKLAAIERRKQEWEKLEHFREHGNE